MDTPVEFISKARVFCKYDKCIMISLLLGLCSQNVYSADNSIFRAYVQGQMGISSYFSFNRESINIQYDNSAVMCTAKQELDDAASNTKPNYPERISALVECQNKIFNRIKSYDGMEFSPRDGYHNLEAYKTAKNTYLGLLNETVNIYQKIGKYYATIGEKKKAKEIFRHIIITYTQDIFKSQVKQAEFALQDLAE